MEKDIMIIDGNSIVNRAYYGVKPLSTREGFYTNAIYGFLNILKKLLNEHNPKGLCVAFDLPSPTFRHKLYDGYKATRKGMPEELAVQLPMLKDVLTALRIPIYSLEGYEADDILGTASRISAQCGWTCSLVTGDRDSFQLVSDMVTVLHVTTRETKRITTALIETDYKMPPNRLIDLKALMGDSSDNIPGVSGVGEKTAMELMSRFKSLDNIYAGLDQITGKLKEKLAKGKEMAYLSRDLGKINLDIPIDFKPEDVIRQTPDITAARALFERLEFSSLISVWGLEGDDDGGLIREIIRPDGVRQNIKAQWKVDFDKGRGLTKCDYDSSLAAWLLQKPETDWEEMRRELTEKGMWKLYTDIEMPLSEVLAHMEHIGIKIDREALISYGKMLEENLIEVSKEIYGSLGTRFNIQSPKQLGTLLFEELKLPHGKKNKTGWSTDAETLEKLKRYHPAAALVLKHRELSKLKSTYADGLLRVADANDIIHSTFQMTATITGRISSTEPNLQNIPVRTELGEQIRKMFIPTQRDWVLIDADYSQIELRVLAHISGDSVMKKAFMSGEDIHTVTASQVFKTALEDVTPTMRRHAKAVNFGIVYGISDFSLAEDIGVTKAQARQYIEQYLEKYSGVKDYMKDIVQRAQKDGYVTTLFGRRRYLPELASKNFNIRSFGERAAMNTPIQGTAADIIKMAMIAIYRRLKNENLCGRLILQVHDELIAECPAEEKDIVLGIIQEEMENVFPHEPYLVAEAHAGKNWLEAK